jgi:hypothetical protein
MLCDGDAIYDIGIESVQSHLSDRLKVLPRYHIENYFLDEQVLSDVFAQMEPDGSILRSPENLGEKLRLFARQTVPVAVALYVSAMIREKVGNVDVMPKGIHQASIDELIAAFQSSAKSEIERVG